jgi:hypothetical protein
MPLVSASEVSFAGEAVKATEKSRTTPKERGDTYTELKEK